MRLRFGAAMTTTTMVFRLNGEITSQALIWVRGQLDACEGDLLLDFSRLLRMTSDSLPVLEEIADLLDGDAKRVVLRGVNVSIYKVLKLVNLSQRFRFVN
jgi:ABC-type transporter Mla MlaB component